MVQIEVEYTYKYMALHMVTTSHFEGIFEVLRHNMSREEAKKYVKLLGRYHHTGFEAVFTSEE